MANEMPDEILVYLNRVVEIQRRLDIENERYVGKVNLLEKFDSVLELEAYLNDIGQLIKEAYDYVKIDSIRVGVETLENTIKNRERAKEIKQTVKGLLVALSN